MCFQKHINSRGENDRLTFSNHPVYAREKKIKKIKRRADSCVGTMVITITTRTGPSLYCARGSRCTPTEKVGRYRYIPLYLGKILLYAYIIIRVCIYMRAAAAV